MPRPGPRPYECVRRAWHSDRHQPIRGSVIQEIFRVVNEVHCSATRKNREWQEKLPIVVLKAEEIMYSKANSEAEYSDLKTLWVRVNDAINTIIRRDETTETGEELLQPCIEAALHLGCTPRRSSRSQRNDSPRYYLNRPETLQSTPVSVPNDNSNTKLYGNHKTITPLVLHHPHLSSLDTPNPSNPYLKGDDQNIQNRSSNFIKKFPTSAQAPASSPTWSVYPLFYNNSNTNNLIQSDELKLCSSKPTNTSSRIDASGFIFPSNRESGSSRVQGVECDLTLRLGSLVAPRAGSETSGSARVVSADEQKFLPRSG
ncbi:hypothetical protein PHJA_002883400 [Phtheirospermum japonicum]|uniref:Histone acetyltransferase n=1 Tax=Phtheirospermum japonicum TaxID=374723 RepID=A0A830D9M7_9LAMI|nr:hypothetical protein PHJA_002883400 [Phtheirospermum japonicum]